MPMDKTPAFPGFPREAVSFLRKLKRNNDRDWFEKNRGDYEKHVLEPAKAFVSALGPFLKSISPNIVAVPKVNKSIFRIHRDTRFSADKSPYKPNLGLYFWEGPQSRMESPGFYFHLEPPSFFLSAGYYSFPDWLISSYRKAVVDPGYGKALSEILGRLGGVPGIEIGGRHYKRVPQGYDASHPNAGLLLHNGLYASWEERIPDELFSSGSIGYCADRFRALSPLFLWCTALLRRSHPPRLRIVR
jgi:uncharacterized protein (TIGR02453 family)